MKKITQALSVVFYSGAILFGLWFLFALVTALVSSTKDMNTWEGFFSLISLGLLAIGMSLRTTSRTTPSQVPSGTGNMPGDFLSFIVGKLLVGVAIFFCILGILSTIIGIFYNSIAAVVGMGVMMIGVVAGLVALLFSSANKKNAKRSK